MVFLVASTYQLGNMRNRVTESINKRGKNDKSKSSSNFSQRASKVDVPWDEKFQNVR